MESDNSISSSERKFLKGVAMRLKPAIHVGRQGLTPNLLAELDRLLKRDELVKIRFESADKNRRTEILSDLRETASTILIGSIGHTASVYRPNPELAERLL